MSNPFEEINSRLSNIESLLLDIKHKPIDGPPPLYQDEFLTVQEASIFLSVSVQTIYNMTHEKRIPFMKRAKKCYFLKEDLTQYLKQGRNKTSEEISEEADMYINNKKGVNHG